MNSFANTDKASNVVFLENSLGQNQTLLFLQRNCQKAGAGIKGLALQFHRSFLCDHMQKVLPVNYNRLLPYFLILRPLNVIIQDCIKCDIISFIISTSKQPGAAPLFVLAKKVSKRQNGFPALPSKKIVFSDHKNYNSVYTWLPLKTDKRISACSTCSRLIIMPI